MSAISTIKKSPDSSIPALPDLREKQQFGLEQIAAFQRGKDFNGNHFVAKIIEIMNNLKKTPTTAFFMNASATQDHTIYVTPKNYYITQKAAGKGAQSTAFFATEVSIENQTSQNRVIKVAKKSFCSEKNHLLHLSPDSKSSKKIDHIIDTFTLNTQPQKYIGVFDASQYDLCHVDYRSGSLKGYFIVKQLIDMAKGIASFHRANMVLRDIKGANLLCNWGGPGKVTDFGLVKKLHPEKKNHSTAVTPTYAAPYIWSSILGQKYRTMKNERLDEGGYQGKAADVFAFGRTLQLDVINQILRQRGQTYFVTHRLTPARSTAYYSDESLLKLGSNNPGKVFYARGESNGKSTLYLFEDPEKVYQRTLEAINSPEATLHEKEHGTLKDLALLAKELQNPSKEGLLSFLGAKEEDEQDILIQKVISHLKKTDTDHSPAPSCDLSSALLDEENHQDLCEKTELLTPAELASSHSDASKKLESPKKKAKTIALQLLGSSEIEETPHCPN